MLAQAKAGQKQKDKRCSDPSLAAGLVQACLQRSRCCCYLSPPCSSSSSSQASNPQASKTLLRSSASHRKGDQSAECRTCPDSCSQAGERWKGAAHVQRLQMFSSCSCLALNFQSTDFCLLSSRGGGSGAQICEFFCLGQLCSRTRSSPGVHTCRRPSRRLVQSPDQLRPAQIWVWSSAQMDLLCYQSHGVMDHVQLWTTVTFLR